MGIGIVERVVGVDRLGINGAIGVLVGSIVVDLVLSVALELRFRAVLGASFVGIMAVAATPIWRTSSLTGRPDEDRGGAAS
jgi:CBS-domain-containing membrane protein